MNRRSLAPAFLVLSLLAAPGALSAAEPAAAAPDNPVDPAAVQALKDMSAHLMTLERFQVSTELSGERVLADGQKLQQSSTATIDVHRPNRVRARMASSRAEREIVYDGKTVGLSLPTRKQYATAPFTGTVGELIAALETRFGVEFPLYDLFVWGSADAPLDSIESAMNAGQDFVGDDLCDHYAFRQGDLDWQIWITTGAKPLPRKLVITNRDDEARPQSVSIIDWDLRPAFAEAGFTFKPPKGSTAVELRARSAQ